MPGAIISAPLHFPCLPAHAEVLHDIAQETPHFEQSVCLAPDGMTHLYAPRRIWPSDDGNLTKAHLALSHLFQPLDRLHDLLRTRDEKVCLVDWGCGQGIMAEELQLKYGNRIQAYGYSKDSYGKWNEIADVVFVHADACEFRRCFLDQSIHMLLSQAGLGYLGSPLEVARYIRSQIIPCMKPQGIIAFDLKLPREYWYEDHESILRFERPFLEVLSEYGQIELHEAEVLISLN